MCTFFSSDINTEPQITNTQIETSTMTSYLGERPSCHVPNWVAKVASNLSVSLKMCFGCSKEPSHREGSFEHP